VQAERPRALEKKKRDRMCGYSYEGGEELKEEEKTHPVVGTKKRRNQFSLSCGGKEQPTWGARKQKSCLISLKNKQPRER